MTNLTNQHFATAIVFGIYETIDSRHAEHLRKAATLCDILYVAVSCDEEVAALFGNSRTPVETRMKTVEAFCAHEGINARIIKQTLPWDAFLAGNTIDAYILTTSQYQRFGQELERIIQTARISSVIETI